MAVVWNLVHLALTVIVTFVLARIVIDWVRNFARSWWPSGVAAVGVETVYSVTDPPIKLLRRLVPPVRIGPMQLDLSVLIMLIILWIARGAVPVDVGV